MSILTKTIRTPVKAADTTNSDGEETNSLTFEGYAAVFNVIDSGGDKIVPGAFAETLSADYPESGAGIPVYWNHKTSDPFMNLGMTTTAVEDEHGLKVEGNIDTSTTTGKQVAKLLLEKRVAQMSFAYEVSEGAWVDGIRNDDGSYTPGFYELRKLRLFEVSICPIGMNQETEVSAKKAILGLGAHEEPQREITVNETAKRRLALLDF